jgi:hypothetical protein
MIAKSTAHSNNNNTSVNIVNIERMVIAGYEELGKLNFYNNQGMQTIQVPKKTHGGGKSMDATSDKLNASSVSSIRLD